MISPKAYKYFLFMMVATIGIFAGALLAVISASGYGRSELLALALVLTTVLLSVFSAFILYRFSGERERERGILREVFEGSRAARIITDNIGKTIYTNQKFASLCDVSRDTASLTSLVSVFEGNKDAQLKLRLLSENAERGGADSVILSLRENEKNKWLQIIAQPVAGYAGFVHWRIDDITDTHNVQEVIREEREKLINFTDNAPVGFFSVDKDGKFLFINPTLASLFERDIDDILKNFKLHDFLQKPPKNSRPYDVIVGGGSKQVGEVIMKKADGKPFLVSINQSVISELGGDIRTNAVVHDLTTERQMVKALEASENRFQRFLEEAPLGVVIIDDKGKISDCNAVFSDLISREASAMQGNDFLSYVSNDDKKAAAKLLEGLGKKDNTETALEISLIKDEGVCAVQMHARRFKESGTTILHFIDLTEKKSLEAQFVQSQKMQAIGQLAGGVAHDFNNLLTAMIGFCDLLLIRHKAGDPSFSDISQIKQNANRASNLVRQLLAFSRQQTLRPRVLDVTDTLTELSHLLRRLLGVKIALDVVHEPNLGLVKVDEGQLEQVLINMAVNARDAMLEGKSEGSLTIQTSNFENAKAIDKGTDRMPAGKWVRIDVKDTGCGIPREIMDRIFEPFFTTKKIGSGTGLGLATVYGIVRQTGGYVSVESVVDKGTTFSIFLPRHEGVEIEETTSEKAMIEGQDLTGTATILLVEDEDAVRTFGARALTNKGYDVLEANSGEAALEVLSTTAKNIDLVVSDVIMPGIDGIELIKTIRKDRPDVRVILISGYTEDKFKDDLGEDVHFMPKPFTLQQLASKVKEVLG